MEDFDLDDVASLCLSQDFATDCPVKKLLQKVVIGKPPRDEFFRVNPDPGYRLVRVGLHKSEAEKELFLIPPKYARELEGDFGELTLYTVMPRAGDVRLWDIGLPKDGRWNSYHETADAVAHLAMEKWVRVKTNLSQKTYETYVAQAVGIPEPDWSEVQPFSELVRLAFRDKIVDSDDHPLFAKLRGL
jgi:hypothetical protein